MNSGKILSAARHNILLSIVGLIVGFGCSVLLVRSLGLELYAQYSAALAIISIATLILEAGGNTGLTRYMNEAGQLQARGTFYRAMRRRRWIVCAVLSVGLVAIGPLYARTTEFRELAGNPWLFVLIAVIVSGNLTRLLAHYGLMAQFEHGKALLAQHLFLILKAVVTAGIALSGGGLTSLLVVLLILTLVETLIVDRMLWKLIKSERASIPAHFLNRAQHFGLLTIFDKVCATLGGGPILFLILAPIYPAEQIAWLALASDLVTKLIGFTFLPMGNLIAPYLSQTQDNQVDQRKAISRLAKFSSLLIWFAMGAALLFLPWLIPTLYGPAFTGAVIITLLLVVPSCIENWVRGFCSAALLRNGRYREVLQLNLLQASLTLGAIVLTYRSPLDVVLISVGAVRCVTSILALSYLGSLVDPKAYITASLILVLVGAALGAAYLVTGFQSVVALGSVFLQGTVYLLVYGIGLRWIIVRDQEIFEVLRRLLGNSSTLFEWFLPVREGRSK